MVACKHRDPVRIPLKWGHPPPNYCKWCPDCGSMEVYTVNKETVWQSPKLHPQQSSADSFDDGRPRPEHCKCPADAPLFRRCGKNWIRCNARAWVHCHTLQWRRVSDQFYKGECPSGGPSYLVRKEKGKWKAWAAGEDAPNGFDVFPLMKDAKAHCSKLDAPRVAKLRERKDIEDRLPRGWRLHPEDPHFAYKPSEPNIVRLVSGLV